MDNYNKIIPVYEVRVEKGCGKKADFMSNVERGKYVELKKLLLCGNCSMKIQ